MKYRTVLLLGTIMILCGWTPFTNSINDGTEIIASYKSGGWSTTQLWIYVHNFVYKGDKPYSVYKLYSSRSKCLDEVDNTGHGECYTIKEVPDNGA